MNLIEKKRKIRSMCAEADYLGYSHMRRNEKIL